MKPHAIIELELQGTFDITVKHADGTETVYPKFKNKIVNQGLDALGGVKPAGFGSATLLANLMGGIAVGTGNTAPSATDTALLAPLAFSTAASGFDTAVANSIVAPYSFTYGHVVPFTLGAVVGNIAEIGVILGQSGGTYTAGWPVFSRALIQVGGSPGTITLTSSDQLIVTYQLQWIMTADATGSIQVVTDGVPGSSITWDARPNSMVAGNGSSLASQYISQISFWNQGSGPTSNWWSNTAFVAANTNGSQVGTASNSAAMGAYTAGTYTRSCNFHWNTGNTVAARTMVSIEMTNFHYQILFSAPISLTTLQTLDFNVQVTWAAT